eukprot:593875-Pelagomonas_calceolata.AAC.1
MKGKERVIQLAVPACGGSFADLLMKGCTSYPAWRPSISSASRASSSATVMLRNHGQAQGGRQQGGGTQINSLWPGYRKRKGRAI